MGPRSPNLAISSKTNIDGLQTFMGNSFLGGELASLPYVKLTDVTNFWASLQLTQRLHRSTSQICENDLAKMLVILHFGTGPLVSTCGHWNR